MSARYELTESIDAPVEQVFAVIDDLPLTSKWLPPCVSLTNRSAETNAKGDKLHYVYKQGGKQAEMEGEILERVVDKRLFCKYYDTMFDVYVDLVLAREGIKTLSTHKIEIVPKTFFGKMLSPLIRLGLRKQTRDAAKNLKRLMEDH